MRTLIVGVFILIAFVPQSFAATETSDGTSVPSEKLQSVGTVSPKGTPITLINPLNTGDCSASNSDCLGNFLTRILDFVIRIGAIVVVLMLVFVGFKFVTAQGEPGKISEARQMLLWTLVGALILLGAKVIAVGITATVQALSAGK